MLRVDQTEALTKYSTIWAGYEAFYDNMEQVRELKLKREELKLIKEQSESPRELLLHYQR